ncbi:hypothetical protein HMPREF2760_07355 [Corynebacterium sp. HMSC065D07]|uniref:hypothetical protein n=1 Tax=Corynebacterium sp. HMSC065D07 TaxID=1739264 RepID=UPI0008A3B3B4|nr:hypothetical protein [Corynebacterium sp. HMSC065D07]OFL57644.1 hypothetical protein HMPREF2760_07355 [Corynebacterium sp. HMSC065D07]
MNHLDIDRAAREQIRDLFGHACPAAFPSLQDPPRTARALALLSAQWEDARRASEAARRTQLEELDHFVGLAHGLDADLSSRLDGAQ